MRSRACLQGLVTGTPIPVALRPAGPPRRPRRLQRGHWSDLQSGTGVGYPRATQTRASAVLLFTTHGSVQVSVHGQPVLLAVERPTRQVPPSHSLGGCRTEATLSCPRRFYPHDSGACQRNSLSLRLAQPPAWYPHTNTGPLHGLQGCPTPSRLGRGRACRRPRCRPWPG